MQFQARARADVKLVHCWAELACAKLSGFAEQSLNCLAQGNGGGTVSESLQKQNSGHSQSWEHLSGSLMVSSCF